MTNKKKFFSTNKTKFRYHVEKSSYVTNHDQLLVHLRMIAPDGYIEQFSYSLNKSEKLFCGKIDEEQLLKMQERIDQRMHDLKIDFLFDPEKQFKADGKPVISCPACDAIKLGVNKKYLKEIHHTCEEHADVTQTLFDRRLPNKKNKNK